MYQIKFFNQKAGSDLGIKKVKAIFTIYVIVLEKNKSC